MLSDTVVLASTHQPVQLPSAWDPLCSFCPLSQKAGAAHGHVPKNVDFSKILNKLSVRF